MPPAEGQAAPAGTSWRRGVLPGLLPVLALLLLGYLVPMGTVLWTSMHRGTAFGFAAYAEVLSSAAILHILLRTLWMAATVTLLCLLLGYPLPYVAPTRAARWAALLLAFVAVPCITSILICIYAA